MSDMKKCFRCGLFDSEDGVWVCRMHGHSISEPFREVCPKIIQVDDYIDNQVEDICKKEIALVKLQKELATARKVIETYQCPTCAGEDFASDKCDELISCKWLKKTR